jgi:hypothetical protein
MPSLEFVGGKLSMTTHVDFVVLLTMYHYWGTLEGLEGEEGGHLIEIQLRQRIVCSWIWEKIFSEMI